MLDFELVLLALSLFVLAGLLRRDLVPQLLLFLRTQGLVVDETFLKLINFLLRLEAVTLGVGELAPSDTSLRLLLPRVLAKVRLGVLRDS